LAEKGKPLFLVGTCASIFGGAAIGGVVAKQLSVSPTELDADCKGARISGDPQGLISALSKLEASNKPNPIMKFFLHLMSGYPSTDHRQNKLREIAAAMPHDIPPVIASLKNLQMRPSLVTPPQALGSDAPGQQVSSAALAERMGTPVMATRGAS
jgi:hypothetical protein